MNCTKAWPAQQWQAWLYYHSKKLVPTWSTYLVPGAAGSTTSAPLNKGTYNKGNNTRYYTISHRAYTHSSGAALWLGSYPYIWFHIYTKAHILSKYCHILTKY